MSVPLRFTASPSDHRQHHVDRLVQVLLGVVTLGLLVPLATILSVLIVKAWPAISWSFIVQNPSEHMTGGGLWAPLIGTASVVVVSLALAAPVGVLAGVYLNEYAGDNWATRVVSLAVVSLAGVPSIVHGLFGVGAFVLAAHLGRSLLAAALTLAVMTLPVIIASTTEALASVPMAFREACWNLGATRWQTVRTMVLPHAVSGILTGVILQVSRAAGETAPILFTGVVFYAAVPESGWHAWLPYGLGEPFMALSYHLFTLTTQVTAVSEAWQYGTALVLIVAVLAMNAVSIAVRWSLRLRQRW